MSARKTAETALSNLREGGWTMSRDAQCVHLPDFAGELCAGCGCEIDAYGNTENDFRFCCFPDCGCDGARLCMAGSASERASEYNVEGMYSSKSPRDRLRFFGAVYSGEFAAPEGGTK